MIGVWVASAAFKHTCIGEKLEAMLELDRALDRGLRDGAFFALVILTILIPVPI